MKITNFFLKLGLSGCLLLFCIYSSFADRREIVISKGEISSHPSTLVFVHQERVGIALAYSPEVSVIQLLSFSTQTGMLLDAFDLKQDFGFQNNVLTIFAALKTYSETGTVIAYGLGVSSAQRIVCLKVDENGHFTKNWATSYPPVGGLHPELTFSDTGSRIYILHNQIKSTSGSSGTVAQTDLYLDLVNAENGSLLDQKLLAGIGQTILFNKLTKNAVITAGSAIYLINSDNDRLSLTAQIAPPASLAVPISGYGLAISKNGRFLITYAGHTSEPAGNIFISYDMEMKTSRLLSIANPASAALNTNIYSPLMDTLFTPLYQSRTANIIALTASGELQHLADVTLPKRSPKDSSPNFIAENNVALSPSMAIGFLALNSGLVFSFDTLTGEILDMNVGLLQPDREHYIQIIEQQNATLVARDGANKIVLIDVGVAPQIEAIQLKKKRAIIQGKNFLSGLRVQINGVVVANAERNPANPGHEITINLRRKDLPKGQDIVFTVVNRDGLTSKPFTIQP